MSSSHRPNRGPKRRRKSASPALDSAATRKAAAAPALRTAIRPEVAVDELLVIDKIVAGGAGFGHRTSGEPVFVRGALPGDQVRLRTLTVERGYSRAKDWTIAQPSTERRTSPCPYVARCGGCDLMPLSPAAQRQSKHHMVTEVLRRTARLDVSTDSSVPLHWNGPARDELGYRSRIRVHIGEDAQLGFRASESHDIVAIDRCLVASPAVNQILDQLRTLAASAPDIVSPFRGVEIRALGDVADLAWFPRETSATRRTNNDNAAPKPASLALERIRHAFSSHNRDVLMGIEDGFRSNWRANVQAVPLGIGEGAPALLFAPGAFTQVNWAVNEQIVNHLVTRTQQLQLRTFADLYCGAGNFSLPLLAAGLDGYGVEQNELSVSLLRMSSQRQGLGGQFTAESVHRATQRWVQENRTFDLVVIDPPRAGFKEALKQVAQLASNSIFLCACDPVTFARDLRALLEHGFVLESLTGFDMFPQTHHVELAAWLSRNPA